ncbi:hypothetical protein HED60_05085 [Planctomycetales bacterium ZRK34]|nr:hypothetical protein HED60_05085 [Planctomycetales bacterium ZRK34]
MDHTTLDHLIDAYLDGDIAEAELESLQQMLMSDAEAKARFWEAVRLHGAMRELCLTRQGMDAMRSQMQMAMPAQRSSRWRIGAAMAAAAAIVLAVGVMFYTLNGPPSGPQVVSSTAPAAVAMLTDQNSAVWADRQSPATGQSLNPGRLKLTSGTAQLMFADGAVVTLYGPAELKLDQTNLATLTAGTLTAWVPEQAHGFTVQTPRATIVDLGTEFGLRIAPDGTGQVHVFDGQVRVTLNEVGHSPLTQILLAGQSAALASTQTHTLVDLGPTSQQQFVGWRTQQLDVVDLVAGGVGTTQAAKRGINPSSGQLTASTAARPTTNMSAPVFSRVDDPMIDGVFVPDGPTPIDSTGHTFSGFPNTAGNMLGAIWTWRPGQGRFVAGPVDKVCPEQRGVIYMHANAGVTIDLNAVRQAHPGWLPSRLRLVCANIENVDGIDPRDNQRVAADLWVIVDGQARFKRTDVNSRDGVFEVDVELTGADRFLTLAATDAGNSFNYDWLAFGDPVMEMISYSGQNAASQQDQQE